MEREERYREARKAMVRDQIERRKIRDPRLLEVMRRIPRHWFVPADLRDRAYDDAPLPLGEGATISQPYIVAAMTAILQLDGSENVLEIGTGSGYQAAILSQMARSVHTIERNPELARRAHRLLAELGFDNVFVHEGDGTLGWPPGAPFQAILVTAAAPDIPDPLVEQLDENGRLVIPVGGPREQELERWRKSSGHIYREHFFPVAFVPLLGRYGWKENKSSEEDEYL